MKKLELTQMEQIQGGRDPLGCVTSVAGSIFGLVGLGILIAATGPAAPMTAGLFASAFLGGAGTGLSIGGAIVSC